MANKIINKLLGSYYSWQYVYTAGPECVKWENDVVLHPDDIQFLTIDGQECPVLERNTYEISECSWTRGDTKGGMERVTNFAFTKYILLFKRPSGSKLEYTASPNFVSKIEPVV